MSREPQKPFDQKPSAKTPDQGAGTGLDDLRERASDVAAKTKEKAGQVADAVTGKLDQQREAAAEGLGRVASTIHEKADEIPGGPAVVNFTHTIAGGMESTATYLREHDFSRMGEDLLAVCRRYPTQSFVAALGIGFLLGRSRR